MSKGHFKPTDYFSKPEKPYPEFPLFAHANGCWAKKIRGKMHYFGPWDDPDAALAKYLSQKDDLHAGRRTTPTTPASLTVKDLANEFLNAKAAQRDAGELAPRSWQDYKDAIALAVEHFGKNRLVSDLRPDDFTGLRNKLSARWGLVRLGNVVQRIRSVFKWAADSDLVERPVRCGPQFRQPSKKTLRVERARKGPKLFTAEEIRKLLDAAGVHLRAMILLGINCGFGNTDCGTLPLAAVDLDRGVIDYARPKTGIARRCVLWPETVSALRDSLARRPTPRKAEHSILCFVTKYGQPWAKLTTDNTLGKEMTKLMKVLGPGKRAGLGFYTLRHTFRTIADEARDQPAADYVMGHEAPHMSSHYRERISDERLKAVTDHVRAWLFPQSTAPATDLPVPPAIAHNLNIGFGR